ncbi:STAS domain-containing protein [Streptomyces sp. NPDC001652]|uniref:STAS domain-containing protein n=1 Tax=Streptomyces sp. NPDC001652 TaxID=3154393 RepID=UPI0033247C21
MHLHQRPPQRYAGAAPRLTVSALRGHSGLRAVGEVGHGTHEIWERALEQALGARTDVYRLELSEVTFVDVAGADALASAARRLEEGRLLQLHRPPSTLSRTLDMFWPGLSGIEVTQP